MKRWLLGAAALALGGCTTLDLDGDLRSAPCASDADCVHLESRSPTGPCEAWRCLEARCAVSVEDADGDGFASAICTGSATDDCDDTNASTAPGHEETTNGLDDDCNGIADDVELLHGSTRNLHSSLARMRVVAATHSPTFDGEGVVITETNTSSDVGAVSLVHPSETDGAHPFVRRESANELPLVVREVATAQLTSSTFALAVVPDGDCRRVAVAIATEELLPTHRLVATFFDLGGNHYARGLPDDAGNDCTSATLPHARSPSLSTSGLDVLVVWIGSDASTGPCDAVADAPLLAHPARVSGNGIGFRPSAATRFGATDDGAPTALAAVGTSEFLGVHVDDHALVVSRFVVEDNDLVVTELGRFEGSSPGVELHRPHLAIGETDGHTTDVAIAYVEGACDGGTVRVRRLALVRSDAGISVAAQSDSADAMTEDGSGGSRAHAFVHASAPSAYFPLWIDSRALWVRGVDRFGNVFGPSTEHPLASGAAIVSLGSIGVRTAAPWEAPSLAAYVVATLESGVDVLVEHTIAFP